MNTKHKLSAFHFFCVALLGCIFYKYSIVTNLLILKSISYLIVIYFYIAMFTAVISDLSKGSVAVKWNREYKLLYLYLLCLLIILCQSIQLSTEKLVTLFLHPLAFSGFLIAFLAFRTDTRTSEQLIGLCRKVNNIVPLIAPIDFLFFNKLPFLSIAYVFVLVEFLFFDRLTHRRKLYISLLLLFTILSNIATDDRANVILLVASAGLFLYLNSIKTARKRSARKLYFGLTLIFTGIITFYFSETYEYLLNLIDSSVVSTTDTRSFLFLEFFEDFNGDDWLFGRGFLGSYYSPYFDYLDSEGIQGGDHYQRFSIEVGFLEFLLKGGLLLLIPFIMIITKALYKGFVKNDFNNNSFRLSIILLFYFLILGISNPPMFYVDHIVLWLIVGIIYAEKSTNKNTTTSPSIKNSKLNSHSYVEHSHL